MMATNYCVVVGAGLLTFSGAKAPGFVITYYCGEETARGVMRLSCKVLPRSLVQKANSNSDSVQGLQSAVEGS